MSETLGKGRRWLAATDPPRPGQPVRCVCGETCWRYLTPNAAPCIGVLHVSEVLPEYFVHFCDHPDHDPDHPTR